MQSISTAAASAKISSRILSRSIGKKLLMSFSGLIVLAYVVGHLLGNLQIFAGQNAINRYAVFLKSTGPLLWIIRAFLLSVLVIHIWTALRLYFENLSARPIRYMKKNYVEATLSSRTMIWTGLGVFLFVVYHILQFTMLVTNPEYIHLEDPLGRHDVYSMVILGFQNYLISAVYITALAIICYHLAHAVRSMFQTWGLNNSKFEPILHKITIIFAWLIFLGYVSIPISVLIGLVKLPKGVI